MANGERIITLKDIDADEVNVITEKFFRQNYSSVDIVNKILKNDIWIVKVFVSSFGQQSNRILSIESRTGRIISCE